MMTTEIHTYTPREAQHAGTYIGAAPAQHLLDLIIRRAPERQIRASILGMIRQQAGYMRDVRCWSPTDSRNQLLNSQRSRLRAMACAYRRFNNTAHVTPGV
jgi:hypothetical protein